jgi:hypothetical protein
MEAMMPYSVLEREIKKLDAEQQNSVVMFVRFLLSQKTSVTPCVDEGVKARVRRGARDGKSGRGYQPQAAKIDFFGSLKDKIKFIAPDFDEPIEDFAEYM